MVTAAVKGRVQRAAETETSERAATPILLYHSVDRTPSGRMAPWTVTPSAFAAQLDAIVEAGCTSLLASELVTGQPLPPRPVAITFDDGFADNLDVALPMLLDHGLRATVYVVTGLLDGVPGPTAPLAPGERMLAWSALKELAAAGVEIGAHGHSHRPLDMLAPAAVMDELAWCRGLLADEFGSAPLTFAYPFGYATKFIRRLVADSGFSSACGVGNTLCQPDDDRYYLPRLMVTADTTVQDIRRWLDGRGPVAARHERVRTRAWRAWRRVGGREEAFTLPTNGEPFRPLAVATVDLDPPAAVRWPSGEPTRHHAAVVLVREHGEPLQTVTVSLDAASPPIPQQAETLLAAAGTARMKGPSAGERARPPRAGLPSMAAVVATRDRPELLARCLDTLLPAAAAVDAEVIVVDSGPSSSDTAALVARSYPSVRYLRQPRPGLSLARNTGLHATEADVVAFTDDDVVVDPAWLARIRGVFDAEPRAVCVTGLIMAAELDTPAQLWLERLGGYAKGFTRERYDLLTHRRDDALYPFDLGRFGSGANIGVRRRDFVTLGGFDEALGRGTPARGGEDLDAFRRILKAGGLLVYEPGAIVWHYHRRMETGLRAAAVADGIGLGATLTKWALEDPIAVLGLLRRTPKVLLREWERRPAKVIAERSTRPPALGLSRTFGLVMGPAAYLRSRRLNPTASPSSTQPNRSSVQGEPSGMSTVAGRFGSGNRIVPTVSVVIPALNEARNLPYVFARLPEDIHEVVLVDGHSTDDTVAVARRLYPDVKIVTQDGRGKGNALQCGFRACTADIIVTLDADGSTDPAEIPRFIAALLTGADFAKGTRFVTGGGSADIDRLRRMGNRILSAMVNHLFGTRYSDLCYGYNAFWRTSLMALGIDCDGFEVETLMNIRGAKAGIHIIEVPSYEAIRLHGQSNLRVIRDGWRVLRTILRERVGA